MEAIWSPLAKFKFWAQVEMAVIRAKVRTGQIQLKKDVLLGSVLSYMSIDPKEIDRIETQITRHDVKAFLVHTNLQLPEALRPHWHTGMTSYDVQDTALGLQMSRSVDVTIPILDGLMLVLKDRAFEFKNTPQIGRTHGVHAELITFGVKLARWYEEAKRHRDRLVRLRQTVAVGKISGAVGMYTLDPVIEQYACEELGLTPVISTQILPRDIIAEYVTMLAIVAGFVANIAENIRLLVQTEIREVQEFFDVAKQVGSSAMPHKRNPISSENLSGQGKTVRAMVQVALENQITWHERSLDNSSAERNTLPAVSHLTAYMISRMTRVLRKMFVYPKRMERNIGITLGLIHSQEVMILVADKSGLPREEAHELVRQIAQDCYDREADFLEALKASNEITSRVSLKDLEACFDPRRQLRHVDYIFTQVFGNET